jgi:hypothetical protein
LRELSCAKKKDRLAAVSPKSDQAATVLTPWFELPALRFTFADRSLAFSYATSKAKG